MELKGKQIRFLRGLGHHLQPVVMIGKEGISESLEKAVNEALDSHELIKLKIQEGCLEDRHDVAKQLVETTGAALVQVLGKTILLFRAAENPVIVLPRS